MRDLKPLLLPNLHHQAARRETWSDTPEKKTSSRRSSLQSDASPISQTFSTCRANHRVSSSTISSLSSSPPRHEASDPLSLQKKNAPSPSLPNVEEHPTEGDDAEIRKNSFDYYDDIQNWNERIPSVQSNYDFSSPVDYDLREGFASDSELAFEHRHKRRRSGELGLTNLASRVITRFPSLSKKHRDSKRASAIASSDLEIETSTPHSGRSRSSSRARSIFRRSGEVDLERSADLDFPSQIETIAEDEDFESSPRRYFSPDSEGNSLASPKELLRVSTPLIAPLMNNAPEQDSLTDSALQSPIDAIRTTTLSTTHTPVDTPRMGGVTSPALSTRPSFSSFQRPNGRPIPLSDIPTLMIADDEDEWSERLGHANFHIYPAPYLPQEYNNATCTQLFQDWKTARIEFSKHLHRTTTHFGPTSSTYQMTEEKWAGIDMQWRQNFNIAMRGSARNGETCDTPTEPEPVAKIPIMGNPAGEGKFPDLGDEDIVGPMDQATSQMREVRLGRTQSKKSKFLRMLGIQPSASVLG